jgi:hypothetical protein
MPYSPLVNSLSPHQALRPNSPMKRLRRLWRETLRPLWFDYEWPVVGAVALGGVVLIGDAAEPWLLRKAGVPRAAYLFALCGDDGVNAEVAVRAAQLLDRRSGPPLTRVVHIFDPQLCSLLRERELDASSAGRLRLEFFNVYDLGARVLLEENPLTAPGMEAPAAGSHLVIVGVGRLGESLLVNAARRWQAAGPAPGARLHVTLVDQDAQRLAAAMLVRGGLPRAPVEPETQLIVTSYDLFLSYARKDHAPPPAAPPDARATSRRGQRGRRPRLPGGRRRPVGAALRSVPPTARSAPRPPGGQRGPTPAAARPTAPPGATAGGFRDEIPESEPAFVGKYRCERSTRCVGRLGPWWQAPTERTEAVARPGRPLSRGTRTPGIACPAHRPRPSGPQTRTGTAQSRGGRSPLRTSPQHLDPPRSGGRSRALPCDSLPVSGPSSTSGSSFRWS